MTKPRTPVEVERQKRADKKWRSKNAEYKNQYLKTHREKMATDLEWKLSNNFQLVRNRAKLHGIEFTLTHEWLAAQPRKCAVTGVDFVAVKGRHPLTPSFDRIDPKQGYTLGNTRLVTHWYNTCKMEWPDEQIKSLILAAAKHLTPNNGYLIPDKWPQKPSARTTDATPPS